ncbi:hypothetical protein HY992_02230 [Candidatus Micrarchaeota archaeon]|nr:hypothetical protein [Candidatus Micrarchaeota archaeon]
MSSGKRIVDARARFGAQRQARKNGLGSLVHMPPLTDYKSLWAQARELLAWGVVRRMKVPKEGLPAEEKISLTNALLALIDNGDLHARKSRITRATDEELLRYVDRVVGMWTAESSLKNKRRCTSAVEIPFTIRENYALFTIAGYMLMFNAERKEVHCLLRGKQVKIQRPKRALKKFVHTLLELGRQGDTQAIAFLKKAYPHIEPTEPGPESA